MSQCHTDLHVWSYPWHSYIFCFCFIKIHSGVSQPQGVKIWPFQLLWLWLFQQTSHDYLYVKPAQHSFSSDDYQWFWSKKLSRVHRCLDMRRQRSSDGEMACVLTYLVLCINAKMTLVFEVLHDFNVTLSRSPEQRLLSVLQTHRKLRLHTVKQILMWHNM